MKPVDMQDLKSCGHLSVRVRFPPRVQKNKYMKKILFLSAVILFYSCNGKEYKYKIEGQIPILVERQTDWNEINVIEELRPAIAYTDTIYGRNNDSIWYYNTDGSKLTIFKPYKVYLLK